MEFAAPTPAPVFVRKFRLRQIALPTEHGAWGFLLEPLVGGMAVAYSSVAPFMALMVIGAFLARRPIQIVGTHLLARRWLPQTEAALKFSVFFSLFVLLGVAGSLAFAEKSSLIPFMLVLPLAAGQLYFDVSRQSRELLPEVIGAVAMSSSAAAITLSGGLQWQHAVAIWFFFIARLIPSILYVRNRLRLEKGKSHSIFVPMISHGVGFAGVLALAIGGFLPLLTIPMFLLLFTRSSIGLSRHRTKMKAMKIGVWEVIYGSLTVLSLIIGHHANL